jgi:predicted helicase
LICARTTKQIINLLSQSNFCAELRQRGYSWMTITSKTGAIIDGKKVNREVFFNTLNTWGKDPEKKFVVIHHSILSEGINVSGLEAVIFMRNMDYIGISQSIGRVIRLGD